MRLLIPEDLVEEFEKLDSEGLEFLYEGELDKAWEIFEYQLDTLYQSEREEGRRYHKGTPFHNLGLIQLKRGKVDEGLRKVLCAFIEDILDFGEKESANFPASRLLRQLKVPQQAKDELAVEVKKKQRKGDPLMDPLDIVDVRDGMILPLGIEVEVPEGILPSLEAREVRAPRLTLTEKVELNLKGTEFERRVFIGGSYKNIALLRHIASLVEGSGYQPMLVADIPEPFTTEESYEGSMELLKNCKHAVFETSFPNGHMMEIQMCQHIRERREMRALIVWQVEDSSQGEQRDSSRMLITREFTRKPYSTLEELKGIISEFLPE
ncbi:MAG: hypothetical protein ACLFUV_06955 [Methanomassiliicoccales archaeon]